MEFPHLGKRCSLTSCKQLDFLPMKCDACQNIFCKDHVKYEEHYCESAYKKDVQVPVCPLCNKPIPVPRGERPDMKVGEHIDRDCQSDPAVKKRKDCGHAVERLHTGLICLAYSNRCSLKGCKQKELIPVTCETCRQNFCLKHRHEQDHNCTAVVRPGMERTSAGKMARDAAAARLAKSSVSKPKPKPQQTQMTSIGQDLDRARRERQNPRQNPGQNPRQNQLRNPAPAQQPGMSEDEALALAIQASLNTGSDQNSSQSTSEANKPLTALEQEDLALARALAESEREEENRRRLQAQGRTGKKSDCHIS